jgi:methionyl-tRNA synthetase
MKAESDPMTTEIWGMIGAVSFLALAGGGFLWLRRPVYHWYCGRCKKVVSESRSHPGKCTCGTDRLMAYVCQSCASWNTSPAKNWHCLDCASTKVRLGVEYHIARTLWRWRNQNA